VTKPVIEHRGRPIAEADPETLATLDSVVLGGGGQYGHLGFAAPQRGEVQITIGRVAASRCLCYDLRFFDQGGRGGQLTGEEEHVGALDQGEGKLAESAGFPGKPDVSAGEGVPPVVVPQVDSSNVG
jgi:hypothetical protein